MIKINYREIEQEVLRGDAVMKHAVHPGLDPARSVQLAIDLGAAIMTVVERRVAGDEVIDIAIRVDAPSPAQQKGLEITFCGKLQCRCELGRLHAHVKAALLGHGL